MTEKTIEETARQEFQQFVEMREEDRFIFEHEAQYVKETESMADPHYVFHTAWAARVLADIRPEKHIDISSSLYFNTIVSAFVPIDFYDYRPVPLDLEGLKTKQINVTALPFADSSVPSLSCMHVVEHIGLGRYGDPLDPVGDLKAISELKRVLSGHLLFVAPISKMPRIIFNLHRIYSYDQIISYFGLELTEFALISDSGDLIRNAVKEMADEQTYGCGCFLFKKGMEK